MKKKSEKKSKKKNSDMVAWQPLTTKLVPGATIAMKCPYKSIKPVATIEFSLKDKRILKKIRKAIDKAVKEDNGTVIAGDFNTEKETFTARIYRCSKSNHYSDK